MKKERVNDSKNHYKVIISEIGISPLRMIRVAFALMGIIPLLILFYIIIGKKFLYTLFLGSNGLIVLIAIFISFAGFLYAYNVVSNMVRRLLAYSSERKQSDDEKTELLLAISHDLKTPLTIIKTGIHNLLDGVGGVLGKAHSGVAEICLNAVDRIGGFIDELLDVSKTGFIRMGFRRNLVNFERVVKNETEAISELAKKNNQKLKYKIESRNSDVWADEKKISRAVMNLLSNAVKYTPKGGRIEALVTEDENALKFAVKNSGPGIPPDKLDKIFNKYERLKEHSGIEGTGLGLSIVKEIVDLHNGHITAKSELNKETEFSMVLPKDLRSREKQ